MEKFYEKKNLGIPVTILVILAYFIGYSLTRSLSDTLLVAIIFAGVVFSLQFDDRVKNAVKHSYIFAVYFNLLYLVLNVFSKFISMFYGGSLPSLGSFQNGFFGFGIIPRALTFLYTYALIIADISIVVIFGIFILMSLLNKDLNLFCVKKVLGEAPAKNNQQAHAPAPQQQPSPAQQQPVPAPVTQQQPAQVQQPVSPQQPTPAPVPQAPERKVSGPCAGCGKVNNPGAKFCASCGTKLG